MTDEQIAAERNILLSQWVKPSSEEENALHEGAVQLVTEAIHSHHVFSCTDLAIYTKGSYRNRTNVPGDSDVDIVIELREGCYYDYAPGGVDDLPSFPPSADFYQGAWSPTTWRAEVLKAIIAKFGTDVVDSTARVAIAIDKVSGSRPSIDIVPSIKYYLYHDAVRSAKNTYKGSCVYPRDGGTRVVNWAQQQYDNGVRKDNITGGRYKQFVRALKNAENALVANKTIPRLPSYLMECLIYEVDNETFTGEDLEADFRRVLINLWKKLKNEESQASQQVLEPNGIKYLHEVNQRLLEPNEVKYLFSDPQKWSVEEAKSLVEHTWNYMRYGEPKPF